MNAKRTRYQQTHRPVKVTENKCPDTGKLTGFLSGYRKCRTCGRVLLRDVPHRPNQDGAFGWTEHYDDGSTFEVPADQTPKAP